jgi:hypothetical protein
MRELFNVIPAELFRPLAAPGAPVYAGVLFALFAATKRHHQPLSRELAVNLIADLLAAPDAMSATDDVEEMAAQTAQAKSPGDIVDEADRIQARSGAVLRALVRYGWLRIETQSDFTQYYILPDYAFRLLETMERIAANEPIPLRGLIYSIYSMLQTAVSEGNEYIGISEASRQSRHLMNGLKELHHNIGAHIEQVLRQLQANEILAQVFSAYRREIVDRAYHQLRTTDHVSRFRPGAMEALAALGRQERLATIAQRMHAGNETESVAAALAQLLDQLHEIRDCFDGLDRTLDAIDARHSQFVGSAVRAVELQLAASSTTSGQLHAILSHLLGREPGPSGEPLPAAYTGLVSLFELGLVNEQSLAPATRAAAPFVPEESPAPAPSDGEIEAAKRITLLQLTRAVSRDRVRRFAADLLRDRQELRGVEIPVTGPEELPLLIYLRHYGDGSLGYTVKDLPGADWIEHDSVGFRDFVLRRSDQ